MGTLREELAQDVWDLIRSVTGFDPDDAEDEENFGLCYDFAASNLLYHNCLDPDEKTIMKCYRGLAEKLDVHAEREKRKDLETLLKQYNESEVFKERHPQFDIRIRLLSLLWHLSNSNIKSKWKSEMNLDLIAEKTKDEEKVDWKKLLAEGEEVWVPGKYHCDSDLSSWSSEEDIKESKEGLSLGLRGLISKHSSVIQTSESMIEEIREAIQPTYWLEDKSEACQVVSSAPSANFVREVDSLMRKQDVNPIIKEELSEYQVLRECLWMLQDPQPSKVFQVIDDKFEVRKSICLSSATCQSLSRMLNEFCQFCDRIKILKDFASKVFQEQRNVNSTTPFTIEAYSDGVRGILFEFHSKVLEIELKVRSQSSTFTILNLISEIRDHHHLINSVFTTHSNGLRNDEELENWKKGLILIAALYEGVLMQSNASHFNYLLELFLKTCAPYLRIIGTWLVEGRLEDFRDEFICTRGTHLEDETFWEDGFIVRPYESCLADANLQLPDLFKNVFPKVITAGKSIEILNLLEKKGTKWAADVNMPSEDLFQSFLGQLRKEIYHRNSVATEKEEIEGKDETSDMLLEDISLDPYLALAFQESLKAGQVKTTESVDFSLYSFEADPLKPIAPILERCLLPLIERQYTSSSDTLLRIITHTLKLEEQLRCVRRIFFMEAGDLMYDFYTDFFRKLENDRDHLDSLTVSMWLQDCVSQRYPDDADRYSILIPEDLPKSSEAKQILRQVVLIYNIDWPLNVVLTSKSFSTYNKVFRFLLEVKWALWALQQIRFKDLKGKEASLLAQKDKTSSDTDSASSSCSTSQSSQDEFAGSPSLIIHRILLLRSWLFHFVGSIHAYFMSRVLHSTELELHSDLINCVDLSEVIAAHSKYLNRIYDRCFFHKSARVLREAVLKILELCHRLSNFCKAEISTWNLDDLNNFELTYVNAHEFLATTLSSMTQKFHVPHLDGLAAALLHSMPSKS